MDNHKAKIYLVVPRLIEQPTWGGRYILQQKRWTDKKIFKNLKIGQSYELFSDTNLRGDINSSLEPSFTGELGYAMQPDKVFYKGDKTKLTPIKKLIEKNAEVVLGKKVLEKHGKQIKILIKLTQAKGNSFQIHVREQDQSSKWRFKPESWYYFEPALLTLGAKKQIDWNKYKTCCLRINKEMEILSKEVLNKKLSFSQAKIKAKKIIKKHNPWQYVNVVKAKKDDLIDLSCGGLHHSWEEDVEAYPLGNIVYELCLDIMDPISVVRCFDKGKFEEDGTLRKLDIVDYFKYIDRSPRLNNPKTHQMKPKLLLSEKGVKIESFFKTKYYCLDKMTIKSRYSGRYTNLEETFHHLFVKEGRIEVIYNKLAIELTKGHSCFIPNSIKQYTINCKSKIKSEILKTFIS